MKPTGKPPSQTLIRIRRRRRWAAIRRTAAWALGLALATGIYAWWTQLPATTETPATPRDVAAAPPEALPSGATLPRLEASDAWVRKLAQPLAQSPAWQKVLAHDNLIQSATVAVLRVGDGGSPAPALASLGRLPAFRVVERDGTLFVDPGSYRRYDALVAAMETVDARNAAQLYRFLRPLFREAYARQGFPDQDFDVALAVSIEELWATPVVEGDIEVLPSAPHYIFRDPALEDLSGAQKQMLRIGPEHQRRVRKQLAAFARELDLPARLDTPAPGLSEAPQR